MVKVFNHYENVGVMHYSNGDKYEGQWSDNKRNGEGIIKLNFH